MTLLVIFRSGKELYAIRGSAVERFVPLVSYQPVPHAPDYVKGIFDLQGTVVPAVDLGQILHGQPAAELMSARIIVVRFPLAGGESRSVGLVVDSVVEMYSASEDSIEPPVVNSADAPYLGMILRRGDDLVHVLELSELIPEPVQETLFLTGLDT